MCLIMKAKTKFLVLFLVFFPVGFFTYSTSIFPGTMNNSSPLVSALYYGTSNYDITQSVTYQVEVNFSLTHNSGIGPDDDYWFKFPRLNNRMPNSTQTKYTPPYQESVLLYNNVTGYNPAEITMGKNDKFNNTYDLFNATLLPTDEVSLDQKYVVKLNAINFQDISDSEIGTYDMSDEIFALYCNYSEPYYERDDASLIALSNSTVDVGDNPVEKARKIHDWVSDNLIYNGSLPVQEMGALWAYTNLQGDCSEYSSLMITLLRIQDIPARKVTGFLVSNNPSLRPKAGDTWSFYASDLGFNMLGHAWVEYYVPDIGWIACDPLWSEATNYFNRIDFLRFNLNVGANFFFPPFYTMSEFSNPMFAHSNGSYNFDYDIKITVLATNLSPSGTIPILLIVFITVGVAAVLITLIIIIKRSRKKDSGY